MHQPTLFDVEEWRDIPGYEGSYQVSSHGNVRSLDRIIVQSNGVNYPKKGCTLKKKLTRTGYHVVTLWGTPNSKHFFVHRLVLEAFKRKRNKGEVCRHLDDDPLNNKLSNICWGTPSENNFDMVRNGIHPMSNKALCPRGHLLALPNLTSSSVRRGKRDCLACNRARGYLRRHQDLLPNFEAIAGQYYESIMNKEKHS